MYSSKITGERTWSLSGSKSLWFWTKCIKCLSFIKGYSMPVLGRFSIRLIGLSYRCPPMEWLLCAWWIAAETEPFLLLLSYIAPPNCSFELCFVDESGVIFDAGPWSPAHPCDGIPCPFLVTIKDGAAYYPPPFICPLDVCYISCLTSLLLGPPFLS